MLSLVLLLLGLIAPPPDSWAVHLGPLVAGYEYVEKGDLEAALREFQKAIAIAPNDTRAQYGVGYVHLQQGRPALAVPYFRKAFEVASEDDRTGKLNAAMSLAEAYMLLKETDEAIRWIGEARSWFEKMGWTEEVWRRRLAGPYFQPLREDPRYKALVEGQKVPLTVPPSVQRVLGKDIGRSYIYLPSDPRRGFLYVVGEQPSITKRSFLMLIQATRELARRPELTRYRDLRVWHIRIVEEEDPENYISFVFDPHRLDEMMQASDAAFFLAVDYILAKIGGQPDTYERWSGKPPNVEVQPDVEKRRRLLKELGL